MHPFFPFIFSGFQKAGLREEVRNLNIYCLSLILEKHA